MTAFLATILGNEKLARIATRILIAIALIGAVFLALKLYGDSRYRAGKADESAAWHAASDKLVKQVAESTADANRNELARTVEHVAKVEKEKERIDAALANGTSPIDELFPSADRVR